MTRSTKVFINKTKPYLEQYKRISVREKEGEAIVKEQYHIENCVHLVDPTLCVSGDFWRKYESKRKIKSEYILVYTERIERAWEFANWRTHSDFYDAFILAKAKNEYPDVYNKCLSVTRKDALVALNVPTSRQNKLRAIVMWLCPPLIPFLLKIREKKSKVIITHR